MISTTRTTDFDELTASEEEWELRHLPLRPERFEGFLTSASIGAIGVEVEGWNSAVELAGTSPRDALSFVLLYQDVGSYLSNGFEVDKNRIDVFGSGCEVYALIEPGTTLISCSIPTEAREKLLDSPVFTRLKELNDGHRVIRSTPRAVVALRNLLAQLLRLSSREALLFILPEKINQILRIHG